MTIRRNPSKKYRHYNFIYQLIAIDKHTIKNFAIGAQEMDKGSFKSERILEKFNPNVSVVLP